MRAIAITFSLLLVTSICAGDTIVLKDGRRLQGKVIARSRGKIAIKTNAGKLVMFKNDEVAEIVKGDKAPGEASVPEPIAADARGTSGQCYYLPVEVRASGMPFVTSYHVDFEELLAETGDNQTADTNSIRVLKMSGSERGEEVKHRFLAEDSALVWLVEGVPMGDLLDYRVTFTTGTRKRRPPELRDDTLEPNLFVLGDFETETRCWRGTAGRTDATRDTTVSHRGAASLRIPTATLVGWTKGSRRGVPVKPSTAYRVSLWVKSDGRLLRHFGAQCWPREGRGNSRSFGHVCQRLRIGGSPDARTVFDWTRLSFTVETLPTTAFLELHFGVQPDAKDAEGCLWVDDVRVAPVAPDRITPELGAHKLAAPGARAGRKRHTYYVAPDGDDSHAGTALEPFRTFAHTMTRLRPGDALVLKDGTYTEALDITVSGTPAKPVTIGAEHDGKAVIDGENARIPCQILGFGTDATQHRHDIVVEGLRCQNSPQNVVHVLYAHDIKLRRLSAYNAASSGNYQVIRLTSVTDSLLEDCAAAGPGRKACQLGQCDGITVRRFWGRWDSHSSKVNRGICLYNTSNCLIENCVVVTDQDFGELIGVGPGLRSARAGDRASNNRVYGTVARGYRWAFGFSGHVLKKGTGEMIGNELRNCVGIGNQNGFLSRCGVRVENVTIANGARTHKKRAAFPMRGAPELAGAVIVKNCSLLNGYNAMYNHSRTLVHTHNNLYGFETDYEQTSAHGTEMFVDPRYETAKYGNGAFLMVPRTLRGKGEKGADIGAEVLYRYQDGKLTDVPLWPWPMEERIFAETGQSVTWEKHGGLWKTLDGVYSRRGPRPIFQDRLAREGKPDRGRPDKASTPASAHTKPLSLANEFAYGYFFRSRDVYANLGRHLPTVAEYTNTAVVSRLEAVPVFAKQGLRVLLSLGGRARGGLRHSEGTLGPVIKAHRDHILALYLVDEPYAGGMTRSQLASLVDECKRVFPDVPVFVNFSLGPKGKLRDGREPIPDNIDLVGFDHYVQGTPAEVKRQTISNIQLMKRLGRGKPVFVCASAFVGWMWTAPPSREETAAYIEAASEGGAAGLLWYFYGRGSKAKVQGASSFPEVISAHRELAAELEVR